MKCDAFILCLFQFLVISQVATYTQKNKNGKMDLKKTTE